jgi:hypothetical protein
MTRRSLSREPEALLHRIHYERTTSEGQAGTRGHTRARFRCTTGRFYGSGRGRACPAVPRLTYPFCTQPGSKLRSPALRRSLTSAVRGLGESRAAPRSNFGRVVALGKRPPGRERQAHRLRRSRKLLEVTGLSRVRIPPAPLSPRSRLFKGCLQNSGSQSSVPD